MEQKIVIKVRSHCKKCRSKALAMAATESGVISVALEGEKKDQVVVIGDGVDAAGLTSSMRKKLGYASLELVEEIVRDDSVKEA
ncbi:heavy metal-associated isoprenylated plant protein 47 [Daucus carota subsp. sativus]|uniref:HMA domain-containing protein n=1 Tax=Daucus carota subsp. sativus TaxID=79200 RepID=A0A164XN63_DAUCS|nr:PREDICTED: uncharacterized protein LOC108222671 [Daucus carota subsp. sativus]